jgi:hypothetical protein
MAMGLAATQWVGLGKNSGIIISKPQSISSNVI